MGARGPQPYDYLTPNQCRYLAEVARGGSLNEVATRMGVQRPAVAARLSDIYRRLGLNRIGLEPEDRRQAAIDRARRLGLIPRTTDPLS